MDAYASNQVTSVYERLVKEKPDSMTVVWDVLFRAVRDVGQDEDAAKKLVDFVLKIQEAGDVLDDSGQQVKLDGQGIWRDLPGFPCDFRLYGIYKNLTFLAHVEHADKYDGDWLDQVPKLLSATTFGALYMEAGILRAILVP